MIEIKRNTTPDFNATVGKALLLFLLLHLYSPVLFAQVKIGDFPALISPYSLLELESNSQGLLLPRMSTIERDDAFDNDAPAGMLIFNTDMQQLQFLTAVEIKLRGKRYINKEWRNTTTPIRQSGSLPEMGTTGEMFYNPETQNLYGWEESTQSWQIINAATGGNRILIGDGAPEINHPLATQVTGQLYLNAAQAELFVAVDNTNDGAPDQWLSAGAPVPLVAVNGLSINQDGAITLGGALQTHTTLTTNPSATLAISGLQENPDLSRPVKMLLVEDATGVLRKTDVPSFDFQELVVVHVALNRGARLFSTPAPISDQNKINVYRNGVLIDFVPVGNQTIELEPEAECYTNDVIRIIQRN